MSVESSSSACCSRVYCWTEVDSWTEAYRFCRDNHDHPHDYLDEHEDVNADEFEERAPPAEGAPALFDALAHELPNIQRGIRDDNPDNLGNRDNDRRAEWRPRIGRYKDDFPQLYERDYWKLLKAAHPANLEVDTASTVTVNKLNKFQTQVYDRVVTHYRAVLGGDDSHQLLLNVDGPLPAGTGKSFLIQVLSLSLQTMARTASNPLTAKSPVLRVAPTGSASFRITGQTLHALFALPVKGGYRPLKGAQVTMLNALLGHVKYLIVDEKSMLSLRVMSWVDQRLR